MGLALACECGHRMLMNEDYRGDRVACPYCGRWLAVQTMRRPKMLLGSGGVVSSIANGPAANAEGRTNTEASMARVPNPTKVVTPQATVSGLILAMAVGSALLAVSSAVFLRLSGPNAALIPAILGMLLSIAALIISAPIPSQRAGGLTTTLISLLFSAALIGLSLTDPSLHSATDLSAAATPIPKNPGGDTGASSDQPLNPQENDVTKIGAAPGAGTSETGTGPGVATALDPVRQPYRRGDWLFQITDIRVGQPRVRNIHEFDNAITDFRLPGLLITLRVSNQSLSRRLEYRAFRLTLLDNFQNPLNVINLGSYTLVDREMKERNLKPGQELKDLLFYDLPMEKIEYLDLEITSNMPDFGAPVRIRIPRNAIPQPFNPTVKTANP